MIRREGDSVSQGVLTSGQIVIHCGLLAEQIELLVTIPGVTPLP